MNYFLGIDIAKTNHVASLINNSGDVVIRAIKFTNSNEGFNKLLTTIQDKLGDLSNIEVAMEATGHYWLSLYSALTDNGFNVSVYNPYLRHAIHTASLVAISNEPELRAYYDKKISEGKHHFVALAGISRKLLTIIYYILKEDRDYIRYDNIKDNKN